MITGNMKPVAKTGTFTLNIATMLFDIANLRVTPNGSIRNSVYEGQPMWF